ncbi:tRNA methyltransferase 44 [Rhizopus azygosporus]|uniref:tRNA (uracil-O(2)-)-methyltransferase n=1 Tax=Rhizopus azygosporus TaxID=86630 RepID=A0A367JG61_RHIAZ|nr:tRNA methyltransferase 44 [Rhizopus azygosporus]
MSHVQETIDSQNLFSQFDPTLFFENPVPCNEWYILAEQIVPTSVASFWETIKRWTDEPELVIPPIEKAEIMTISEKDGAQVIQRELVPKRKSKDTNLVEELTYYKNEREARVVYRPMVDCEKLPFYYPKYAMKTILHKLFKWCIQNRLGYKKRANHDTLVPKEVYQSMYHYLKSKYGPYLVANWTEKTDPKKFVYEDIAIASYLLCLWKGEEDRLKRKPNFVDLGCGNGLLTFLLNSEGYEGYGIDIAARKIWSVLGKTKKDMLRVQVLYPLQARYSEADWLIGNHADELVPWIPIIASKSGEHCNFMVIPCCFYGLDGTKALSLTVSEGEGKYRAYTNYVKDIATKSGFICEEDFLRIPSTKNIALIGRRRSNSVDVPFLTEAEFKVFVPRKTDRQKDEERREAKRTKFLE